MMLVLAVSADSVGQVTTDASAAYETTNPDQLFSHGSHPTASIYSADRIDNSLPTVNLDADDLTDGFRLSIPDTATDTLGETDGPAALRDPIVIINNTTHGCAEDVVVLESDDDETADRRSFWQLSQEPFRTYRTEDNSLSWLPASGEGFGWLDWTTAPYLKHADDSGFTGAANVHWLSGPNSTSLPPRLYDFIAGYQTRGNFSSRLSYDLSASVGIFSDFEDSARDGVRFPAHAVGMLHVNDSADFVFGVDYLDRDSVSVLPVIGVSLRDVFYHGLRMDLVFPRPRVEYTFNDTQRMYLSGKTDGGTWDVKGNRVVTYIDYQLSVGFETASKDGRLSSWEFGYVFNRSLEVRNQAGETEFDDAFVIRWVTRQ